MGVYLSEINMPKAEGSKLVLQIFPNGEVYDEHGIRLGIANWAEAVPVPPHGRLVDADALVERIEGIWDCNDMVFRPNDKICKIPEDCKGCKWAQTKDCIQRMVENAPTIIPAEEGE